jgi:hypothetical protein
MGYMKSLITLNITGRYRSRGNIKKVHSEAFLEVKIADWMRACIK